MATDPRAETSADLVVRARKGDRDALEYLFERYAPRLKRWASGRLPPWARDLLDTEDLVQEALLGTFRRIDSFEPRRDGALQAYLRQAVQNRIRDELRRAHRHPARSSLPPDATDVAASPLELAIGHEALEQYERALGRLSDGDREAIVARIELGFSHAEVANALGKSSPDAARMAVSRAIVRLVAEMGREAG